MAELATNEQIAALRRPVQLFTQAYLDDPITVPTDQRFIPETVLKQLNVIAVIDRDQSDFAQVDINAQDEQNYPVHMVARVFERTEYLRTIDKKFKQLVPNA